MESSHQMARNPPRLKAWWPPPRRKQHSHAPS
jgi:hypothetical protein